jgi:hypothetical protein
VEFIDYARGVEEGIYEFSVRTGRKNTLDNAISLIVSKKSSNMIPIVQPDRHTDDHDYHYRILFLFTGHCIAWSPSKHTSLQCSGGNIGYVLHGCRTAFA